ncbi:MAG TPA: DUF1365 domain-containing protein [Acidimicrobiales bacterium]|nr:DUF1365 domain-containing protein [Acidimicrobiales bacterium]
MTAAPCLYDVTIHHSRRAPVVNSFRYRSYMWLFDLDQPPSGYRAADHVDVRGELRAAGLETARLKVLTNVRVLGYVFNPISVYWCYGPGGELVAHVAEVHNTYGSRHAYVLPADGKRDHVVAKAMYVSPFYPVDGSYRLHIGEPGEHLSVSVTLDRPGDQPFRAALSGRRREATAVNRLRSTIRYPAAPLRGRALIQFQGLRLWRRGLEVQPR